MAESDIDAYIMASYLGDDEIEVLKFLRSQPHGVSIEKICNELDKIAEEIIKTVNNLNELQLIRQDRRSIGNGISWDSVDAIYYTIKHRRVAIDKVFESTSLEVTEIIEKNIKDLNKEDLLKIINELPRLPQQRRSSTTNYTRSEYIKEYSKHRANGVCELCNKPAPFINSNGEPYLEVHHIKWLSEGGEDSIDNTAAICPNCHRKMHNLNDSEDVRKLQRIDKFGQNNN
ncbi:MAG: hypothetical protein GX053_05205 [Tissierella sp.]|nr:hypothetical protein [Tissierella sp.]